ncbi:MAG TPA: TetR/AcrR family transcriptional regulator [Candidatus Sericytochromatia bacterium]
MSRTPSSTRARLINAALELFSSQGVTETTTKAIAELAQVNEVTLFRQFGNKQGLLLAVIEDSAVFTHLGESLRRQLNQTNQVDEALKNYASDRLQTLQQIPELLRSVVGEAGQYTLENRQALGRGITQANRDAARYLATVIEREQLHLRLPAEKLASLLNAMLFGYLVIELTSEFHELWNNREDFLESLIELFLHGAVSSLEESSSAPILNQDFFSESGLLQDTPSLVRGEQEIEEKVEDLPATFVHSIIQQAKKQGSQDYALAYVLFGAGLRPEEVVNLERMHQIIDPNQHLLQVTQGAVRQVPVNQWIMGKRYGSYSRNPLSQWLKSRKDNQSALFLNDLNQPMSEVELRTWWQELISFLTPEVQPLSIEQARQTWCVEMLMKGINLEDLSILSGLDLRQLELYARRAGEKAALERAVRLDRKV